jgi:hypothetical protein
MPLVFQQHPDVQIGTLTFCNVPTILQFEDTPLIEVGNTEGAGWSAHFHIFHPDGTSLAVVKGTRLFLTEAGKKANLNLRHEPDLIVCERSGSALFELRHAGASALKAWAELYTPTGILIKATESVECLMPESDGYTLLGQTGVKNATFRDCPIGIHVHKNGIVRMNVFMEIEADEPVEFLGIGKVTLVETNETEAVLQIQSPRPLQIVRRIYDEKTGWSDDNTTR